MNFPKWTYQFYKSLFQTPSTCPFPSQPPTVEPPRPRLRGQSHGLDADPRGPGRGDPVRGEKRTVFFFGMEMEWKRNQRSVGRCFCGGLVQVVQVVGGEIDSNEMSRT